MIFMLLLNISSKLQCLFHVSCAMYSTSWLLAIILILKRTISRRASLLALFNDLTMHCSSFPISDISTKLLASLRWLKYFHCTVQSSLHIIDSNVTINSIGDSESPYLTSLITLNQEPVGSCLNLILLFLYQLLITLIYLFSTFGVLELPRYNCGILNWMLFCNGWMSSTTVYFSLGIFR